MDEKFITLCTRGKLYKAEKMLSLRKINIHAEDDRAFRGSCFEGHLNIAQWLYSLGGVDIHALKDEAFRASCVYGHINIAQWLYSLGGVNIHVIKDEAFIFSCWNGHTKTAEWLLSIDKFSNYIVDEHLAEKLYEYAFRLGYFPINKMKTAYEKYKVEIRSQIKEKNIDGKISLFEIDGLVDVIMCYV